MKASIIIPTRFRAKSLGKRLKTIFKHTPELFNGEAELIIVYDSDDKDTQDLMFSRSVQPPELNSRLVITNPEEIPAVKWNEAAATCQSEWLVTLSDDCIPASNWLSHAYETPNKGFIGLPDGVTGGRNLSFTPLYMATRDWLSKNNGGVLVIPKYKSWYADIETCIRAKRSNTYTIGARSVVTQLHTIFGTAKNDDMYKLGASRKAADEQMFIYRQIRNFPDDFMPVL